MGGLGRRGVLAGEPHRGGSAVTDASDRPPSQAPKPVPRICFLSGGDPDGGDAAGGFPAVASGVPKTWRLGGGIDVCHQMMRVWWNRFAPMFAPGICGR